MAKPKKITKKRRRKWRPTQAWVMVSGEQRTLVVGDALSLGIGTLYPIKATLVSSKDGTATFNIERMSLEPVRVEVEVKR